MFTISAIDGFTFPGMMLEPGWTGQDDLRESRAWARGEQAEVARDLAEVHGVGAQRSGKCRRVAHGLHELDAVLPLPHLDARHGPELLDHEGRVRGLGVQAR